MREMRLPQKLRCQKRGGTTTFRSFSERSHWTTKRRLKTALPMSPNAVHQRDSMKSQGRCGPRRGSRRPGLGDSMGFELGNHDDHAGLEFFSGFGVVKVGVENLHVAAFVAVVFYGDRREGFAVLDGVGTSAGGDWFLRQVAGFGGGVGLRGEFDCLEFGVFFDEVVDLIPKVCGFDLGEWESLPEFCDQSVVAFFCDVFAALFCERALGGEVECALEMVHGGNGIFPLVGMDLRESVMNFRCAWMIAEGAFVCGDGSVEVTGRFAFLCDF